MTQDARYRIQFTIDDVVDKIKEIHTLEEDERNSVLIPFHHDLRSPFLSISDAANYFNSDKVILRGEVPSIHQRAYVSNVASLGLLVANYIGSLLWSNEITRHSDAIHLMGSLDSLVEFLPVTSRVLELGGVSDKRLLRLENIDFLSTLMFYSFNSLFSKDFKRDKYDLGLEIDLLWGNYYKHKQSGENVSCCKPLVINIETKVDYFSNVVIPLIHNVYDHAFNPANNVNHRILDGSWSKHYQVVMRVDEEKKEIVVQVRDNGFGISPDMMLNLFQKGASSKTDKTTEHGVGLWKVKKFVEDNGGRMWVQTKLGEETSFYFTIKYESKDRVYKQ